MQNLQTNYKRLNTYRISRFNPHYFRWLVFTVLEMSFAWMIKKHTRKNGIHAHDPRFKRKREKKTSNSNILNDVIELCECKYVCKLNVSDINIS